MVNLMGDITNAEYREFLELSPGYRKGTLSPDEEARYAYLRMKALKFIEGSNG
jgi:hypothetical protein